NGYNFYRRPIGVEHGDTLFMTTPPIHNGMVFIDGQCEISGQMDGNGNFDNGTVYGRVTIVSADDMWLIGDIRYEGSDRYTGHFGDTREEMERMPHMLGLVSEGDIIIKDNAVNGRENGAQYHENHINRHSIIITASLIALGESFTFEHHNDEWDLYQGPSPDERGTIHLRGSMTQIRKGFVHRSRHGGTGYAKDYLYDYRLERDGPPGFGPGEYPDVEYFYTDHLDLGPRRYTNRLSSYNVRNTNVGTLIIQPGTTLNLIGDNALTVRDTLRILGTSEDSVIIRALDNNVRGGLQLEGQCWASVNYADFSEAIDVHSQGGNLSIENSRFEAPATFVGNVQIDSCQFSRNVNITGRRHLELSRSLFCDGIVIFGGVDNGRLINNTIVGSHSAGVRLRRFDSIELINNIIASNRYGVVNDHWESPVIRYCDTFDNRDGDYTSCEAGQGCISADPMFLDQRRGDFRLEWNSPCVDSGDPDLPHDPDETRSDIGAYYVDHELIVMNETYPPDAFTVTAAPNPFNRQTTLFVTSDRSEPATVIIYDIQGRLVTTIRHQLNSGTNRILVNDRCFTGSGLYFAHISSNEFNTVVKLVYLP
ncbi:MAG: T9SS type A sorting domain-containing protein, partial [Candidatus Electryoneaceae bacterium]|nr:T9SS type A sorting domain-containing protein [Candidatus Electryoneaceae bacterium]